MAKANNNLAASDNIKTSYVVVLFAASVLYIVSCAPGPVWQDSGVIQYRVFHNDIEGRLGLALSHPLFYMLAIGVKYIFPGGFGYEVNIVTAVISAVAVANLFLLLRLWLGSTLPALVGALTLGLSHTFWRHAAIPETYNLVVALLLLELIMLLQYAKTGRVVYLYLLSLVNGLAIANHMLASLAFICYLVLLVVLTAKKKVGGKDLALMVLLWVIGALPYEYLIVRNILESGDLWSTMASAVFGASWRSDVLNVSLSARIVKENFMWMALNFPTPNALLLFVGLWGLYKVSPKRWFANVLLALLVLFFVFAFRYTIVDRYAFFIPSYCIASILIGVGASRVVNGKHGKLLGCLVVAFAFVAVPVYMAAPAVAKKLGIASGRAREIPYRDDYVYFLRPWRTGYIGPEKFAEEIFGMVEPDAIVYADDTTAPPLLNTQQIKRMRPDVKIISYVGSSEGSPEFNEHTIGELLTNRPVYVVSAVQRYCPEYLLERYSFVPAGTIWRVGDRKGE
ncbi:MAG: DUF2723 domain-containing protein [Planctomycetota bacterium]|nr:MAG: DUF2723 domain-containing protein [Planctomycetota bacterium]